ncbi:MAG: amidohydrolase family protein [Candidatus Sumerlaeaceae bacterium]
MFDILIRNASSVDGTGAEPFAGHIAIEGEKIAAVIRRDECGDLDAFENARTVIDAKGRFATPGFVDVHGHSDLNLLACPSGDSKLRQGVTTEFVGSCGESAFPLVGPYRQSLAVNLKKLGVEPRW